MLFLIVDLHDRRSRSQRRDRTGRPARPRLHRLLRPRCVLGGAVRVPVVAGHGEDRRAGSTCPRSWAVPFAVCIPIAIGMCADLRGDPRCADAAAARRLPRDRDDGLRRDHPHHCPQPRRRDRTVPPASSASPSARRRRSTDVLLPASTPTQWYWLALCVLFLLIFLARRLENSRVGRAWLAIREDEDAAAVMGVTRSSSSCGPSPSVLPWAPWRGCCSRASRQYVEPNGFILNLSFLFVAMVVIGGSGNMVGAMLGSLPDHLSARTVPRVPGLASVRVRTGHGRGDGAAPAGPGPEPTDVLENSQTASTRQRRRLPMSEQTTCEETADSSRSPREQR